MIEADFQWVLELDFPLFGLGDDYTGPRMFGDGEQYHAGPPGELNLERAFVGLIHGDPRSSTAGRLEVITSWPVSSRSPLQWLRMELDRENVEGTVAASTETACR